MQGIPLLAPEVADTVDGFEPRDFAFLAQVERDHFWFTARRRLITNLVQRYGSQAQSFIEIGCGTGNVIEAIAELRQWFRVTGVEIHPSGLVLARKRLPEHVELIQLDVRQLRIRGAFDLAGAFDVLEHIVEDESAIRNIAEILDRGGLFIAAVPQHPALWSWADEVAYHVRRYRRGELEKKFRRNGFDVLFSSSFNALLMPLVAFSRLSFRRTQLYVDPREQARAEFTIPGVLNWVLKQVLAAEVRMTKAGVRWPFGSSRVVIGRKR